MSPYLAPLSGISGALVVVGLFFWRLWRNSTPARILAGFVLVGLGSIGFGASQIIACHSPMSTSTGRVVEFSRIPGRYHDSYQFRVARAGWITPVLSANYFNQDGESYPKAVSGGALVRVAYADWTQQVFTLDEFSGPQPGTYTCSTKPTPSSGIFLIVAGILLVPAGIVWFLRDKVVDFYAAHSRDESDSTSILKPE
jgi:hypothetical protein